MNYHAHYDKLIDRARMRLIEDYTEKHHIIPRCLGGDDNPSNIVSLLPEEHYIAHQLLIKMHPGNSKLIYAAMMMTVNAPTMQRKNKLYGWLRREYAKHISITLTGKTGIKRKRTIITCPHCNKTGARPGLIRFHFDECIHRDPADLTDKAKARIANKRVTKSLKGRTYEEIYGIERATAMKKAKSKSLKGKSYSKRD